MTSTIIPCVLLVLSVVHANPVTPPPYDTILRDLDTQFVDRARGCFQETVFETYLYNTGIVWHKHPTPMLKSNYAHYWYNRTTSINYVPYDNGYFTITEDEYHVHIGTLVPACGTSWSYLIPPRPDVYYVDTGVQQAASSDAPSLEICVLFGLLALFIVFA